MLYPSAVGESEARRQGVNDADLGGRDGALVEDLDGEGDEVTWADAADLVGARRF
jgi:hypothetical protein